MTTNLADPPRAPEDAPDAPRLPANGFARFRVLVGRALTRRCPYCGARGIFAGYWLLRDRCPNCGVSFEREEGYFLGAYALNLIVAEFVGLGLALYVVFRTPVSGWPLLWQELIAASFAIALPILFFPYSRTGWMALDLLFDPPGAKPERRLRGHELARRSERTSDPP